MTIKITVALTAMIGVAACADTSTMTAPSATEADFGNSVQSLVKAQTADPATLSKPSTEPVTGVDPDYATGVIKAMREGVAKPVEVKQPIEINVGNR
jgi:type IV pilus biogenesis protein CpaD/CtpE